MIAKRMVTELTIEDLALLTALEEQAQSGASTPQLLEALECQDTCVLGYWQDEQLQGYAIVARLPFEAELQAIGVHPMYRRSGAGRGLMDAVFATSKSWSSERLLLEVRVGNRSAIGLYQRCGFSEDGRRKGYYPPQGAAEREDALLMSLLM